MRMIVGIPNYNGSKSLMKLIPQLSDEDFDKIFVLDDASTDNSLEYLYEFSDRDVEIIEGNKNVGPGANRNRILPFVEDDDIIMFIDADMELQTRNVKSIITGLFEANPHTGMISGGILNKKGKPMPFNYGLDRSTVSDVIGYFFNYLATVLHFRFLIAPIRRLARRFTLNVEISHYPPEERRVDWAAEGHFYIRGSLFKELKGYDERLQYHEGIDLARRVRAEGYNILFNPSVWAKHLEVIVRDEHKLREHFKAKAIEKEKKSDPE
ncbi:MAG: glycosyltransferase [Candidatus Saccharimonadales bacterium]|nr:glycosyltransferase [Candidatus Saccharimonadales bacterium]